MRNNLTTNKKIVTNDKNSSSCKNYQEKPFTIFVTI